MQKFELKEGEVLVGTVKAVNHLKEGELKKGLITIEVGDMSVTMKVQEQFVQKFLPGQTVSIKNTPQGIEAQIVPNLINKLKI